MVVSPYLLFSSENQDGHFGVYNQFYFAFWSVIILDRSNRFKNLYKILSKSWHIVIPIDIIVR